MPHESQTNNFRFFRRKRKNQLTTKAQDGPGYSERKSNSTEIAVDSFGIQQTSNDTDPNNSGKNHQRKGAAQDYSSEEEKLHMCALGSQQVRPPAPDQTEPAAESTAQAQLSPKRSDNNNNNNSSSNNNSKRARLRKPSSVVQAVFDPFVTAAVSTDKLELLADICTEL